MGRSYVILFKKGNSLKEEINAAIDFLDRSKKLEALKIKWLDRE